MKIRKPIKEAMELLDIEKLRPHQLQPINAILDGKDTMVIAPTSFGKSLIYMIPAVIWKDALTIVIEPLLALMHDQVQKLQAIGVAAAYLDSTQSDKAKRETVADLNNGNIQILYIAPERLETGILSVIQEFRRIGMVVVDECHCVTSWGYSFRDAYLRIGEYIDSLEYHPVIVALSATALPEDRPQIMELLSMHKAKCFEMDLCRSNLRFLKKMTPSRKEQQKALQKAMRKHHKNTTIVFCATKHAVEQVAEYLDSLYPGDVLPYHSHTKGKEKELLSGKKHIVVATSALSMGVDIKNVDLVIHFNMPLSLADYYQMAGRAGREGQHARSILLYNSDDYYLNHALLEDIEDPSAKKTALERLDAMKEFCEDDKHCMVKSLLRSLGDPHKHNKCRYCTNCQKER